uniref:PHD and RING finger domain-containing protein 1 n=1 Tax=Anopheles farauti TaxID=69004 RepID=A0A182QZ16_9DIPT
MASDTEDELLPTAGTSSAVAATSSATAARAGRRLRNRNVLNVEDSDNDSSGSGPIAGPSRRRTVPVAKMDLASESSEWESDWNSDEEQLLAKGDKDAVAAVLASKLGYASDESSGSGSSGDGEKCPICLLSLHSQEVGVPEVCEHVFCAPCIEEWSRNVSTCPIDRKGFDLINIYADVERREVLRVYRVQPKPPEPGEGPDGEVGGGGLANVPVDDELTYCEVCRQAHSEETMLLCDSCNLGYHMECLNPPLLEIPSGSWYCDCCFASGSDEDDNELQDLLDDLNEIGGMRESRLRQRIHSPLRIVRTRQSERIRAAILTRAAAAVRLNIVHSSPDGGGTTAAAGPSTVAAARARLLAAGSSAHGGSSSSSSLVAVAQPPRARKTVKRKRRRRTRRKILSMIISEYDVDDDGGVGGSAGADGQKFAIKRKKLYSTLRKLRKKRAKRRKTSSGVGGSGRRRSAATAAAAAALAGNEGTAGELLATTNAMGSALQRQRIGAGITPLKIFGGRNDLDYFSDDDDEEEGGSSGTGAAGSMLVAGGAAMGSRLRNVLGRRRVLKSGFESFSTPSPGGGGRGGGGGGGGGGTAAGSGAGPDLLGSILASQERWHSREGLRNVRINGGKIIFPTDETTPEQRRQAPPAMNVAANTPGTSTATVGGEEGEDGNNKTASEPSTNEADADANASPSCPNLSVYSTETLQYATGDDGSAPYDPLDSERRTDEDDEDDDRFAGERDEDLVQLDDDDLDPAPLTVNGAAGAAVPEEKQTTGEEEQARLDALEEDDGTPARDEFDSDSDDELKKIEADSSRGGIGDGGGPERRRMDALTPPLTTSLVAALGASGAAMAAASAMATANFGAPAALMREDTGDPEDDRSYTPCLDEKYQERRDLLIDAGEGPSTSLYRSQGSGLDAAGIDGMDTELISDEDEGALFGTEEGAPSGGPSSSKGAGGHAAAGAGGKRKDQLASFKKVTKKGRERNYRDKDTGRSSRSSRNRRRSPRPDAADRNGDEGDSGGEGKSSARSRARRPKRKELPRYDIRSIIAEKRPRIYKDPFGRDITPKRRFATSGSFLTPTTSPLPAFVVPLAITFPDTARKRSFQPVFTPFSTTTATTAPGTVRWGTFTTASPFPAPFAFTFAFTTFPTGGAPSPPPSSPSPIGCGASLPAPITESLAVTRFTATPGRSGTRWTCEKESEKEKDAPGFDQSQQKQKPQSKQKPKSQSRSRSRSRSRGRAHHKGVSQRKKKNKHRRGSVSPGPASVPLKNLPTTKQKQKKKKDRKRSPSPGSRTPPPHAAGGMLTERFGKGGGRQRDGSWTPPPLPRFNDKSGSAAASGGATGAVGDHGGDRHHHRLGGKHTSGTRRDKQQDTSAPTTGTGSSLRHQPKSKRLEGRLTRTVGHSRATVEGAHAKPVVIIDLEKSPFRVLTPSPKAVIVLSDSDTEKDKDRRGGGGVGSSNAGSAVGNAAATVGGDGQTAGGTGPEKEGGLLRGATVGSTLGQSLGLVDGPNSGQNGAAGGLPAVASKSGKTPPERRSPMMVDDMFGPKTPPGFPAASSSGNRETAVGSGGGGGGGGGSGQAQSLKALQAPKFSMQVKTKSSNVRPVNPLYDPGDLDEGKEGGSSPSGPQQQEGGAGGDVPGTIASVGPNTPPEPAPQSPSPDVYDPFEPTKSPSPSPTPGGSSRDRSDALSIGRLSDEEQGTTVPTKSATSGSGAGGVDGGLKDGSTSGAGDIAMNGGPEARTPPLAGRTNGANGKGVDPSGAASNSDSDVIFDEFVVPPGSSAPGPQAGQNSLISKLPLPLATGGGGAAGSGLAGSHQQQQQQQQQQSAATGAGKFGDFMNPTDSPYSPGASDFDDLFEPPGGGGGGGGGMDMLDSPPLHAGGHHSKQSNHHQQQQQPLGGNSNQSAMAIGGGRSSKPMPPTKAAKKATNQFDSLFGSSPNQHTGAKGGRSGRKGAHKRSKGGKSNQKGDTANDEDPSKLSDKEKYLKKLNRLERVVEEVKLVIKPYYNKKQINKDEYKDILRRAVPKICHSRTGEINPIKIQKLIKAYVRKIRGKRRLSKKGAGGGGGGGGSGGLGIGQLPMTNSNPIIL